MTSKIVVLTDALGNPVGFELLPGQRHDTLGVAALIEGRTFGGLIADGAFDVNWIVEEMEHRGAEIVIAQRTNRTAPRQIDPDLTPSASPAPACRAGNRAYAGCA